MRLVEKGGDEWVHLSDYYRVLDQFKHHIVSAIGIAAYLLQPYDKVLLVDVKRGR